MAVNPDSKIVGCSLRGCKTGARDSRGTTRDPPEYRAAPCQMDAFPEPGLWKEFLNLNGRSRSLAPRFLSSPIALPITWESGCGCSSMVEQKLPKLTTRGRFPSPAPIFLKNPSV